MEEWNRQQKALKEADREKKKGAAKNLQSYRGTEHLQRDKQQRAQKEADRQLREIAVASLKNYRGGEHDLKELESIAARYRQEQLQKLKERSLQRRDGGELADADGGRSEEDIIVLSDESWKQIVDNNIKEFEEIIKEEMDKAAAEHQIEKKDEEEEPQHQQPDVVSPTYESSPTSVLHFDEDKAQEEKDEIKEVLVEDTQVEVEEEEEEKEEEEEEEKVIDEKSDLKENESTRSNLTFWTLEEGEQQKSYEISPSSLKKSKRRLVELDFSFGLIFDANHPAPNMENCAYAAEKIVPASLSKALQKTRAVLDPRFTAIVNSVEIDPAFDSPSAIRYIVKGKQPLYVSTKKEKKNSLSEQQQTDASSNERRERRRSELIIGRRDEKQWRRVREGARPCWDNILRQEVQ